MGLIPTDDGDADVKTWFDFLVADKSDSGSGETEMPPVIGYSSYYDKIIVCDDLGHNSNADPRILVYTPSNKSFTYGNNNATSNLRHFDVTNFRTNFITCPWTTHMLYVISDTTAKTLKWKDVSQGGFASSSFLIVTKDYDFGFPGVKKKIHRVYITYYGGSSLDVNVTYSADGAAYADLDANLNGAAGWHTAKLKPAVSVNCYSFQLRIGSVGSGGMPSTFKIQDISIVYRMKSIK
jgi:hypothetical protein